MSDKEAKELLSKYEAGNCTDAEKALVEKWLFQVNKEAAGWSDERLAEIRQEVWQQLPQQPERKVIRWPRIAAVAASIVFALGIGGYLYIQQQHKSAQVNLAHNDVPPGKNTATLTLANGQKIILSNAATGQIAQQGGVKITKIAGGQVVYTIAENNLAEANQFNTLSTAKGETYKVNLPDGTQVWLNAASSLTYPARFTGTDRKVALTGEGYFEVAKDKAHPFKVTTAQEEVTVLGTHFNINSYTDEPSTKTTLLEGSVKVNGSNGYKIIKPGQQAVTSGVDFDVYEVNAEEAVAWKSGYFRFNDESIQSIMRKLSRWYNIDVNFENGISSNGLNGKVSRFKNISQVLKALEATKTVHFKVEGRRVTVMK